MQMFVYEKAMQIKDDFDNLFSDNAYRDPAVWGMLWHQIRDHVDPPALLPDIRSHCVVYALDMACDYAMRMLEKVLGWDLRLLWLVYNALDSECDIRKGIATELVDLLKTDDVHLQKTTAWKASSLFQPLLEQTIRDGTLHPQLHHLFCLYARQLNSDTQEVEGINGIIKKTCELFPAFQLQLLNSRVLGGRAPN